MSSLFNPHGSLFDPPKQQPQGGRIDRYGRNLQTNIHGWGPAMQNIFRQMPDAMGTLGRNRQYAPESSLSAPIPQSFYQTMWRNQQPGTMSPFLQNVIQPATERANLEASMVGRPGSGAHAAHIARALGPLYHQEHARLAQHNLAQGQLGLQSGLAGVGLHQASLDRQKQRFDFMQNEPLNAFQRLNQYYSGAAGLGRQTSQTGWQEGRNYSQGTLSQILGALGITYNS